MVWALRAISITIAGALSSAGWFYFSPRNTTLPVVTTTVGNSTCGEIPMRSCPMDTFVDENLHDVPKVIPEPLLAEYEYKLKPVLQEKEKDIIVETDLFEKDLMRLSKGKWLILVYAEWCPHSRAYLHMWRELLSRIRLSPPENPPIFATASFSENSQMAAALNLQKLPSFVIVQNGHILGSAITSPSIESLVALVLTDWESYKQRPREISWKPSKIGAFNMRAFDLLGQLTVGFQKLVIGWISRGKATAYGALLVTFAISLYLRTSGYLNFF